MVAYAEDTKGHEIYTVYIMDIENGTLLGKPLTGITSYMEWAGDDSLVYITMDEILRPDKVHKTWCFSFFVTSNALSLVKLRSIPRFTSLHD